MNILVIEDDSFKYSKIEKLIKHLFNNVNVSWLDNVHDAIVYFEDNMPDKIILDMSLPSHAAKVGEGSPVSMPSGGIEIILELASLNKYDIPILILTQYHEIEMENEHFPIDESESEIRELYGMNDISVVHYENDSSDWESKAEEFLGS